MGGWWRRADDGRGCGDTSRTGCHVGGLTTVLMQLIYRTVTDNGGVIGKEMGHNVYAVGKINPAVSSPITSSPLYPVPIFRNASCSRRPIC